MAGKVEARLKELNISLPEAPTPAANYVPYVRSGALVFIAGQIPISEGVVKYAGLASQDLSVDDAYQAARLCGINIIAQAKAACGGDLDKVTRIVNLQGFVASPPSFTEHAKVLNGVSDLMVEVFGDAGKHSRAAMGSPSLPRNVTVEVGAVIETA
jgi:enamine deaminase RidA (YjgF/YER057c/UK114 family)